MEYSTVTHTHQLPAHLEDDAAVQLRADMEQVIAEATGVKPELAAPLAALVVEGMRARMGGKRVYVPATRLRRDEIEAREKRDAEIISLYNGRNIEEVMSKLNVSKPTVHRVVKRARERKVSSTA